MSGTRFYLTGGKFSVLSPLSLRKNLKSDEGVNRSEGVALDHRTVDEAAFSGIPRGVWGV
jgi:hypothetical protein